MRVVCSHETLFAKIGSWTGHRLPVIYLAVHSYCSCQAALPSLLNVYSQIICIFPSHFTLLGQPQFSFIILTISGVGIRFQVSLGFILYQLFYHGQINVSTSCKIALVISACRFVVSIRYIKYLTQRLANNIWLTNGSVNRRSSLPVQHKQESPI